MKKFTAQEARALMSNSKKAYRLVKSILRTVKRAAKKGEDRVVVSYRRWSDAIASSICAELKLLGYEAEPNCLHTGIVVSWKED